LESHSRPHGKPKGSPHYAGEHTGEHRHSGFPLTEPFTHSHKKGTHSPHGIELKGRKQEKLTQGGRVSSSGQVTPEVARTGGAGQPVGFGSTGNPQYSYGRKAVKAEWGTVHGHSGNNRSLPNRGEINTHRHEGGEKEHHHQFTTHTQYHSPQEVRPKDFDRVAATIGAGKGRKQDDCQTCSEVAKAVAQVKKLGSSRPGLYTKPDGSRMTREESAAARHYDIQQHNPNRTAERAGWPHNDDTPREKHVDYSSDVGEDDRG
jgi:hypothetical protein